MAVYDCECYGIVSVSHVHAISTWVFRHGEKVRLLGREVVKLITPGTLIEPLDNESNYLLCVSTGPGTTVGLAWIDISTGEFQVDNR